MSRAHGTIPSKHEYVRMHASSRLHKTTCRKHIPEKMSDKPHSTNKQRRAVPSVAMLGSSVTRSEESLCGGTSSTDESDLSAAGAESGKSARTEAGALSHEKASEAERFFPSLFFIFKGWKRGDGEKKKNETLRPEVIRNKEE